MSIVKIEVVVGNALETTSDLLLLKYAQRSYGLDEEVALHLQAQGLLPTDWTGPRIPNVEIVDTQGAFPFRYAMFVGTPPLIDLDYLQMTSMARRAMIAISDQNLPVRHITATVHGGGYGLDADKVGLIDLIADGYGTLTWVFVLVFIVPLLTVGSIKIYRTNFS